MIKKLRFLFLLALLIAAAPAARAQFFIGAGAYGHQYTKIGFFPGVQARIGIEANDGRFTTDIGFNYSPLAKKKEFTLPYTDPATMALTTVTYNQRITASNLFFHGHVNLGSDEQNFQFGFIGGFSLDEFLVNYEMEHEPAGIYFKEEEAFKKAKANQLKADLGVKGNYRIGNGAVFAELLAGFPLLDPSADDAIHIKTHYGLTVGYKIYIGETRYAYLNY